MKRVCNRPIQIDALTICYELTQSSLFEELKSLNYGEWLDVMSLEDDNVCEFQLFRIDGKFYENVYVIKLWNGTKNTEWGLFKFNLANGKEENNTHNNGNRKAWIKLNNETLYTQDIHFLFHIEQRLGLTFHNITSLDLACDTPFNISALVKAYAHNEKVTTILNGKCITDRNEDRPELTYTTSGSLNRQNKYLTVNIKQRKAVKDKYKGITIITYDKAAEIRNSSEKMYILEHYMNPKHLFRTEVHLNSDDIKSYVERTGLFYTPVLLIDEAILDDMFFHFLQSVIRFQCKDFDTSWKRILGRS